MKVYLLESKYVDCFMDASWEFVGIFSSRELAEKRAEELGKPYYEYDVTEHTLDETD